MIIELSRQLVEGVGKDRKTIGPGRVDVPAAMAKQWLDSGYATKPPVAPRVGIVAASDTGGTGDEQLPGDE